MTPRPVAPTRLAAPTPSGDETEPRQSHIRRLWASVTGFKCTLCCQSEFAKQRCITTTHLFSTKRSLKFSQCYNFRSPKHWSLSLDISQGWPGHQHRDYLLPTPHFTHTHTCPPPTHTHLSRSQTSAMIHTPAPNTTKHTFTLSPGRPPAPPAAACTGAAPAKVVTRY